MGGTWKHSWKLATQVEGLENGIENNPKTKQESKKTSTSGSDQDIQQPNGNPLQYYYLENSMDRGAWQTTVYGVAKSRTQLSDFTFTFTLLNLYAEYIMRNTGLEEAQAGIKIARRNNNLRYTDDTTLMAEK